MKKAFAYLAILIILLSACNHVHDDKSYGSLNTSQSSNDPVLYGLRGPGPINYGFIKKDAANEYRYDGYINQSPSFKTLDRYRPNLGDDERKVRAILASEQGITPGMVMIVGKDMYVYCKIEAENKEEKKQKIADIERTLSKAMLRYDIHVKVNK